MPQSPYFLPPYPQAALTPAISQQTPSDVKRLATIGGAAAAVSVADELEKGRPLHIAWFGLLQ